MLRSLIAVCAVALVAADPAGAATVRAEGGLVEVTDGRGDANDLTVSYRFTEGGRRGPAAVRVRDDSATLEPGDGCVATGNGAVRCAVDRLTRLVARAGGADDRVRIRPEGPSCDCAWVWGDEGDDQLTGDRETDILQGGDGRDTLRGGRGRDELIGGPGNDDLRGGRGSDTLRGGEHGEGTPAPGRDRLNGGPGGDLLQDNDHHGGEIGPDVVVGGTGQDELFSYLGRRAGVRVNLSDAKANDGEPGEGDLIKNVEEVLGGNGDDVLIGDGDHNFILGFGGSDRIDGRGGNDFLGGGDGRNAVRGGVGGDVISTAGHRLDVIRCNRGRDRVDHATNPRTLRRLRRDDIGPRIAPSCEAIVRSSAAWGIDPAPDEPPRRRTLFFARPEGVAWSPRYELRVTTRRRPFTELGRGASTRRGVRVRIPARFARRARRKGLSLRAEVWNTQGWLQMIWRFRVPRASAARPRPGTRCRAAAETSC